MQSQSIAYSSSATILARTNENKTRAREEPEPATDPSIEFKFNAINEGQNNLQKRLQALKETKSPDLSLKEGALSVQEIENEFKALEYLDLTEKEKITAEEYKAMLMVAVQTHLQKKKLVENQHIKNSTASKPKKVLKWLTFFLLMFFEFAPMVYGGILYASLSLEALIPYIPFLLPSAVITGIGVACVFNMLIGNVSFVAPILLERLGVSFSKKRQSSLPEAFHSQYESTEKINNTLLSNNHLSSDEYYFYARLGKLFNRQIETIKENFPEHEEPIFSKIVSLIMGALIGIQAASSALFLSASIMAASVGVVIEGPGAVALTVFIPTMPWAIALIGLVFLIPQVAMNYYLRMQSAANIFDSNAGTHEKIKTNLQTFAHKGRELDNVHNRKLVSEITAITHQQSFLKRPVTINRIPGSLLSDIKQLGNCEKTTESKTFNPHPSTSNLSLFQGKTISHSAKIPECRQSSLSFFKERKGFKYSKEMIKKLHRLTPRG